MISIAFLRRIGLAAALVSVTATPVLADAKSELPQSPITWPGGSGIATFRVVGDAAFLTIRSKDGKDATLRSVTTVDDALAILADERLAFAWPSLLAWAGDDLQLLRDRAVTRAKTVLDTQLHPAPAGRYPGPRPDGDPALAATRNYIRALFRSGRHAEAIRLAQQQASSPAARDSASFAHVSYTTLLSDLLFDDGQRDKAIAVLEKASADESIKAAWRLNADINLAATLARSGQFEAALTILDKTQQHFANTRTGAFSGVFFGVARAPNAWAQFAWIRACALEGLKRHEEARAVLASIASQPQASAELSTTSAARLNAFQCMHDASGLAGELAAQLPSAPPAGDLFLQFQPDLNYFRPERETTEAAIDQPHLRQAIEGRVRLLDSHFTSALSGWSTSSAPVAIKKD